jgi:hypothetical protein
MKKSVSVALFSDLQESFRQEALIKIMSQPDQLINALG